MNSSLEKIYNRHHRERRGEYFVVLADERGTFLKKHIGEKKKVLDIGCRDGALTKWYAEGNEIIGLDIDSEALTRAESLIKNFKGVQTDLNGDWGIQNESFDCVVAAEVIEHLYYPDRVLEKIHTVLKKDGLVIITIPHAFSWQNRIHYIKGETKHTPMQDPTHINHFSLKSFKKILSQKFEILETKGVYTKKFNLIKRFEPFMFAHDLMFVARKK